MQELNEGFNLAECRVFPRQNSIERLGQTVHLEPKAMAVLLELTRCHGETVLRDRLIEAVWPRRYVTDGVLNRCISQLRSALGDDPRQPEYIATIPRSGYRLLQAPEELLDLPVGGLLVLPFQNLGGDEPHLADGLTELLIARLAVALDERVISRTTAMTYRGTDLDIASLRQRLGVSWLVEGSLLYRSGRVQVVMQLIDAAQDAHLHAETWSRPSTDMLEVVNEVSREIAARIQARIRPAAPAPARLGQLTAESQRRYLQSRFYISRRTAPALHKALTCLKAVRSEDPDCAQALAGEALCHVLLGHYGESSVATAMADARRLAHRALDIEPENAEAMAHLGAVHFFFDWDMERAARRVNDALSLSPGYDIALLLAADIYIVQGEFERGQSFIDRALQADPLNVGLLMNVGDLLMMQSRPEEAASSLRTALEIEPNSRPVALRLALALAQAGEGAASEHALGQALSLEANDADALEYRALVYGFLGRRSVAGDAAGALERRVNSGQSVTAWSRARAWAAAGESERAVSALRQAVEERSTSLPFLGRSPVFSGIVHRPDVQSFLARVGLCESTACGD